MESPGTHKQSLYKLVCTHYLASALAFVTLALLLLFSSDKLSGHYFHPQLLAITHIAALGWGTLVIFGASYQLLPVILDTELYSYRIAWLGLALMSTGIVCLAHSFWIFDPGFEMQLASLLLVSGILLFVLNIFLTARRKRDDIHQEFILTAGIWLLATGIFGSLLVFNFRYAFLPQDHLLFLKLHAHFGLAGWFLMLIIGVSSRLVPMFLVSKQQGTSLLSVSYYLVNSGLIFFVADTWISGLGYRTYVAIFLVGAGIAAWLLFIAHCFRSRMRRKIDLPIKHTLLSFILLVAALITLPAIVHFYPGPRSVTFTTLYGSLLFMGWISSLILGQTFKTLPFIVWNRHYEHLAGRGAIPLPADLVNAKLLSMQFFLYLLFAVLFFIGTYISDNWLIIAGLTCFLLVSILYLTNVLLILLHQPKKASNE